MDKKKILKEVLRYIRRYALTLAVSILCAGAGVALTLYTPVLIGKAVDLIAGPGRVDFSSLAGILLRMGIVVALTALSQLLMNYCNNSISFRVIRDMRRDAFAKLQTLPLSYLDSHPHGDTLSRIIADVDQFSDGLLLGFSQLFTGVLTILGTLLFMFAIHPVIAAAVVVLTPLSLAVAAFIAKRTYDMFHMQSVARGKQTAYISEMVGNQKIVRAFGYEERSQKEFDELNDTLGRYSLQATFYSSLTNPCTRFVNSLVYAAVGILGAFLALKGALSVGQLVSFLSYANQYTKPFNEISGVITEFQNALTCAGRVLELIGAEPEIPDSDDAQVLARPDGTVELENVFFSYNKDISLIENLNLKVKSGQRIAIVGPTGCGKSTIINLLMRFYDVDSGSVSVGGTLQRADGRPSDGRPKEDRPAAAWTGGGEAKTADIRSITRHSLRAAYGMVLQETWLKSGTIRDNIRMAAPEADDEEIIRAAKQSHAHSFIRRLPEGYDTIISEDGENLSLGQRQLLCITRVMLHLPPMLILDEATSSIDVRTEQRIQKAFRAMMEGRTSFIVAHRLSTIKEADVILVMKDGHIIEQGNHDSLMELGGFYSELYNSQFAG